MPPTTFTMFGKTILFASSTILLAAVASGETAAVTTTTSTTSYSTVPRPSQLSSEGSYTGTASSIPPITGGYTTVITETLHSPSKVVTITSTLPLSKPSLPLSIESTLPTGSLVTTGSASTSLSNAGTPPITMPSPTSPAGTSASSSATGTAPAASSGAATLNGAPAAGILGGIMAMVGLLLL
ncbi:hypothetical protein HWV62_16566 [Athelia sp. TMB]|nr:hypothetical protein HWV62_16566 [Athelia sp. TMB]